MSNSKRPFGLLGHKLGHSFSPEIHRQIGLMAGQPYDYVLFEREPEELESFIRGEEWEGLNVTVPYKEAVIPFLDGLSQEAEEIGAVNTIVRQEGKLIGLEGNRRLGNDILTGVLYIMSENEYGELMSLTDAKIKRYTELFWEPETFDPAEIEASLTCRFF